MDFFRGGSWVYPQPPSPTQRQSLEGEGERIELNSSALKKGGGELRVSEVSLRKEIEAREEGEAEIWGERKKRKEGIQM